MTAACGNSGSGCCRIQPPHRGGRRATLRTLDAYRRTISDLVSEHAGRIFGGAGDSVIAELAAQYRPCAPQLPSSARSIAIMLISQMIGEWNSGLASILAT